MSQHQEEEQLKITNTFEEPVPSKRRRLKRMADRSDDEDVVQPVEQTEQLEEENKPRGKLRRGAKKIKESESASMSPLRPSSEDEAQEPSDEDGSYAAKPKRKTAKRTKAPKQVADEQSEEAQMNLNASDDSEGKLPLKGKQAKRQKAGKQKKAPSKPEEPSNRIKA